VDESFRTIQSFIYGMLFSIKRLTWKFIHSFACVNSDMAKANLPLPFDMASKKNGGASMRLIYN
jgi:hypothetical protein